MLDLFEAKRRPIFCYRNGAEVDIHDDDELTMTGKGFRKNIQNAYSSGCRRGIDLSIMAVALTGLIGIVTDVIRKSKDKD